MEPATLTLAGAPIGLAADASPRLRTVLASARVIAAEDTRRLRRLATDLEVVLSARVLSYFDGNERDRTPELLALLRDGVDVVLITDAGMPSVSDPGFRLVAAAVEAGVRVTCLPGPSAVTTALAVSGLPADRFTFEGFPPRKPGRRRSALVELARERRTMVFFEAPHRLADFLADAAATLGADRPAAVCRELTKTYEEVRRGTVGELAGWAAEGVLGEVTVVVAGAPARVAAATDLAAAVAAHVRAGMSRRDAVAAVAADTGAPRRAVYSAAIGSAAGAAVPDQGPPPQR